MINPGTDVKGQLTRSRPSVHHRLPDPRAHILHLKVSQTSLAAGLTETKLPGFLKFLTACQNLLFLELQVPALNDDDLWILSKQCRHLERLTLVSVPHLSWARISDEGLSALCKQAKALRHLHLKVQLEGGLQEERRRTVDEDASRWVISNRYPSFLRENMNQPKVPPCIASQKSFGNCRDIQRSAHRIWIPIDTALGKLGHSSKSFRKYATHAAWTLQNY